MSFPISCDSCGASFRLPESLYEKRVKGRVATIRCKQCAAKIKVDGTEFGPPVSDVADDAGDYWAVSFADDDDRALTTSEIADALGRGDIDGDTIVWREEMEAWTRIAEVAALQDLLPHGPNPADPEPEGEELAIDVDTSADSTDAEEPTAHEAGSAADAKAGSEPEGPQKTGARQVAQPDGVFDAPPDSVLVDLDVDVDVDVQDEEPKRKGLVFGRKPPPPPRKEQPSTSDNDADADIDFLSLSAPLDAEASSSGGAASPTKSFSLDEPASVGKWVLRPPSMDLMAAAPPPSAAIPARPRETSDVSSAIAAPGAAGSQPKRNWLAAGLILVGAAGLMLAISQLGKSGDSSQPDAVQSAAAPSTAATTTPVTPRGPNRSAAPTPTSSSKKEAAASTADAKQDQSAPTAAAEPVAGAQQPASTKEPSASTGTRPADGSEPATTKTPTTPVAKTESPAASAGAPFDRGAAVAALRTAAGAASSCRRGSDPSGTATVTVTFANSGRAINANVSGPPFAGTATGGCIAAAMRRARVPPFSGDRVTVSKRVVIQ